MRYMIIVFSRISVYLMNLKRLSLYGDAFWPVYRKISVSLVLLLSFSAMQNKVHASTIWDSCKLDPSSACILELLETAISETETNVWREVDVIANALTVYKGPEYAESYVNGLDLVHKHHATTGIVDGLFYLGSYEPVENILINSTYKSDQSIRREFFDWLVSEGELRRAATIAVKGVAKGRGYALVNRAINILHKNEMFDMSKYILLGELVTAIDNKDGVALCWLSAAAQSIGYSGVSLSDPVIGLQFVDSIQKPRDREGAVKNLTWCLLENGYYKEAIEVINHYENEVEYLTTYVSEIAERMTISGNFSDAMQLAEMFPRKDFLRGLTLRSIASGLIETGQLDKAAQVIELSEIYYLDASVRIKLSIAYFEIGQKDLAANSIKLAMKYILGEIESNSDISVITGTVWEDVRLMKELDEVVGSEEIERILHGLTKAIVANRRDITEMAIDHDLYEGNILFAPTESYSAVQALTRWNYISEALEVAHYDEPGVQAYLLSGILLEMLEK